MIAVLVAVLLSSPASAQPRALTAGWSIHERALPSGIEDLACGDFTAYARTWSGDASRWDGTAWTPLPRRTQSMYGRSIGVTPDGHAFLEASGALAHWNGTAWLDHPLDRWEGDVGSGFAAISPTEVYYAGRGRIARFDGTRATTYSAGTWRDVTAIAIAGDDLLLGGQGGTILRVHGATITREPTGIDGWVRQIVAYAQGDVWARADGATWRETTLLHWDGRAWSRRGDGISGAVTAIGGSPRATYATTEEGVYVWDGAHWTLELPVSALGEGYHALGAICATRHHVLIADRGGHVIVKQ